MPHPFPVIGIDLGGTNVQTALIDADHGILERRHARTDAAQGLDHVLDVLAEGVYDVCGAAGIELSTVGAIGIVAAGAVDIPNGVVISAPNLGWKNVPLRDLLATRIGRPVVVENDVNGAVWGEYRLRATDGAEDCLGVWVGTGVGGGLVLGGRLHHGAFHTAGEIGQTIVQSPTDPDARGTILEDVCSRTGMRRTIHDRLETHPASMIHRLTQGDVHRLGTRELREAYLARDPLTVAVVDHAALELGVAIANWITVLALPLVIVGGGIAEALGEPWLARIRRSFRPNVFPARCQDCRIVLTELAADAGLLGAGLIAREGIAEAGS